MKRFSILIFFVIVINPANTFAQQQFELVNNFLFAYNFTTGNDEGIEQNLDDNFQWMKDQGYTHLRFFGIFPNGYHSFPSPTLDANGYPTDSTLEATLEILTQKANQHNIIVNFDGWEIIAESNHDTTNLGVEFITEEELANVVAEVLSLGVNLISEEQFGKSYLQAIQTASSNKGATHETTAEFWWADSTLADEQLSSVFSFYHYDQAEVDYLLSVGTYPPSNLGNLHVSAESTRYFGYPFSVAVGSFGSLEAENWKNVLLFTQIQHLPKRFSIEETNTSFTIGNSNFNFMDDVGDEILAFSEQSFTERPIANLVIDSSSLLTGSFMPAVNGSSINNPAIVNMLTLLGYRVVATVGSVIPDAGLYYILTVGGANSTDIVPLPDYVMPLLNSSSTVFLHPAYGIPDENDAGDWIPVRGLFGLPSGDTETLLNSIPGTVVYDGFTCKWAGANLYLTPRIENILSSQINSGVAQVVLSGEVQGEDVALVIRNGNKFLLNSNVIHLEAAFILSKLLNGPLNAPTGADIVITEKKILIFAEYNTEINVDLPWPGNTRVIRYNPEGNKIQDVVLDLGGNYSKTLLRGELAFLTADSTTLISGVEAPSPVSLFHNYPNPFYSSTKIEYRLKISAHTVLRIYDVFGREIITLTDEKKMPGQHSTVWHGQDSFGNAVPAGIYLVQMSIGNFIQTKRLMLLK